MSNKPMFRVYERDSRISLSINTTPGARKWKLLAMFVWKADAFAYAASKCEGPGEIKVMLSNRNIRVF